MFKVAQMGTDDRKVSPMQCFKCCYLIYLSDTLQIKAL